MNRLAGFEWNSGVQVLSDPGRFALQNRLYLDVRQREGRVLNDEQALRLPDFRAETESEANSALAREWRWRARSFRRLMRYIRRRYPRDGTSILDLGCGNGWLARHLAGVPGSEVWAVDVNLPELEQGARLSTRANLHFAFADILENQLPGAHFDLVILAASAQYFADLNALVSAVKCVLKPGGEMHLLDSPFYSSEPKRQAARAASSQYYTRAGVPAMAEFYHHHRWSEIAALGGENLNAGGFTRLLQRLKWLAPFPWVRVRAGGG